MIRKATLYNNLVFAATVVLGFCRQKNTLKDLRAPYHALITIYSLLQTLFDFDPLISYAGAVLIRLLLETELMFACWDYMSSFSKKLYSNARGASMGIREAFSLSGRSLLRDRVESILMVAQALTSNNVITIYQAQNWFGYAAGQGGHAFV